MSTQQVRQETHHLPRHNLSLVLDHGRKLDTMASKNVRCTCIVQVTTASQNGKNEKTCLKNICKALAAGAMGCSPISKFQNTGVSLDGSEGNEPFILNMKCWRQSRAPLEKSLLRVWSPEIGTKPLNIREKKKRVSREIPKRTRRSAKYVVRKRRAPHTGGKLKPYKKSRRHKKTLCRNKAKRLKPEEIALCVPFIMDIDGTSANKTNQSEEFAPTFSSIALQTPQRGTAMRETVASLTSTPFDFRNVSSRPNVFGGNPVTAKGSQAQLGDATRSTIQPTPWNHQQETIQAAEPELLIMNKLRRAATDLETAMSQLNEARDRCDRKNEEVVSLRQQLAKIRDELWAAPMADLARKPELPQRYKDIFILLVRALEETKNLRKAVEDLEATTRVKQLEQQERLQQEKERLQQQREGLQQEREGLQQEKERLQQEKERLQQENAELEKFNKKLKEKLAQKTACKLKEKK